MPTKRTSAASINALKEALTAIYWYKRDLRVFISAVVSRQELLSRLNWEDYKRNVVSVLVDQMVRDQDTYQQDLLNLMAEVCAVEDLSHLRRLEGGEEKAREARNAVDALRKLYSGHGKMVEEKEDAERRRREAQERMQQRKGVSAQLAEMRNDYVALTMSTNEQARGFSLQQLMRALFGLFDLDPLASFRIVGEQIDGSICFESTDYLFEGKWQKKPVPAADLNAFSTKVGRKLDNTLGLFLSLSGYSAEGLEAHSKGQLRLILMDGADLMAVLVERKELPHLLLRKRRHASETGEIFITVATILGS